MHLTEMSIQDLLAVPQSNFWKSKVNDKSFCTFNIIQPADILQIWYNLSPLV